MKKIICFTLLILAMAGSATAQNAFTVADTNIPSDEQGEIIINFQFENEGEMCAYQFDLLLPEGVSLVPNGKRYKYEKGDCYNAMHSFSINYMEEEGIYRVVCVSLNDSYPFVGTSGLLLKLFIQAEESLTDDTSLNASLKNIKLSTMGGSKVLISDVDFEITIGDVNELPGDADGSGVIDIADAIAVMNYILGQPSDDFDFSAADLNGDNKVTIADAVAIVNMILNDSSADSRIRTKK